MAEVLKASKLNFDEIHDIALKLSREPPLTTDNIYVDLLLTITAKEIQSRFDFVLKGGTAILKTNGSPYRFSYDLDFSCFKTDGNARKHYRSYKEPLERLVTDLGFKIVDIDGGDMPEHKKHTESGLIFKLHLIDHKGYLKRPIKFSVSCIDSKPCCPPETKIFKTIVKIPEDEKFRLLYPKIIPEINDTKVRILVPEELCSEKIRALATRGSQQEWHLVLRDVADLYVMDQRGLLDRVFKNNRGYIKQKLLAIKNKVYWKKFEQFMKINKALDVNITDEDRTIFFDRNIIDVKKVNYIVGKVRRNLRGVYKSILDDGKDKEPGIFERVANFFR